MASGPDLLTIPISEKIGVISAIAMVPKQATTLLVLAHGAGVGMTHPFMDNIASEFYQSGIGTLRYNFPYMEKNRRRPDPTGIAEWTVAVVMDFAHTSYPKLKLYAGGKSFGGRMTSQHAAKECPQYLSGIVFLGFPLHIKGNPSTDRAVHLKEVKVPMLFLQGTKDKLAEISLIRDVVKRLKNSTLVEFEGADHSFKTKKHDIIPALVEQGVQWMAKI